jgi:hypothetical protein
MYAGADANLLAFVRWCSLCLLDIRLVTLCLSGLNLDPSYAHSHHQHPEAALQ